MNTQTPAQIALTRMGLNPNLLDQQEPRTIDVGNIGLWNLRDRDNLHIYVGRWPQNRIPVGLMGFQELGNPHFVAPYRCGICDTIHARGDAAQAFKLTLENQHMRLAAWKLAAAILADRRNVTLWCHCSPLACHADIIATKLTTHFPFLTRP